MTSRLSTQHEEAAAGFKSRLGQLKQSLRNASGNGAAFDAIAVEHAAQTAAAAQRHAFELGELQAAAEAEQGRTEAAAAQCASAEAAQGRAEAAIGRLGRSIAHASRSMLTHARNALVEGAPAEATAEVAEAAAASAGEGEGEAMAVAYGAVAAMQASCMDCLSAAAQVAQDMTHRAQLARAQVAELYGLQATIYSSKMGALPLPQLVTAHAAQLDELLSMLRSSSPSSRTTQPSPWLGWPPSRMARPSSPPPGMTPAQSTDATDASSMAARHHDALERGEVRREQLRAARAAKIERGMQAFTTIIYNGSISGGAI